MPYGKYTTKLGLIKSHEDAKLPTQSVDDVGFDIYSVDDIDSIIPLSAENMIDTMNKIRDGRCRKLSKVDISDLYEEICEEMLHGSSVHKDNI